MNAGSWVSVSDASGSWVRVQWPYHAAAPGCFPPSVLRLPVAGQQQKLKPLRTPAAPFQRRIILDKLEFWEIYCPLDTTLDAYKKYTVFTILLSVLVGTLLLQRCLYRQERGKPKKLKPICLWSLLNDRVRIPTQPRPAPRPRVLPPTAHAPHCASWGAGVNTSQDH